MTEAIPHAGPGRRVRDVAWLAAALVAWSTAWVLLSPLASWIAMVMPDAIPAPLSSAVAFFVYEVPKVLLLLVLVVFAVGVIRTWFSQAEA